MLLSFHFPLWICSRSAFPAVENLRAGSFWDPRPSSIGSHSVICSCCRPCSFGEVVSVEAVGCQVWAFDVQRQLSLAGLIKPLSWKGVYRADALWLMTVRAVKLTANFSKPSQDYNLGSNGPLNLYSFSKWNSTKNIWKTEKGLRYFVCKCVCAST